MPSFAETEAAMRDRDLWSGSRPATEAERSEYLAAVEASGLSTREFALRTGISPWTVYGWRRMLAGKKGERRETSLVEVRVLEGSRNRVAGEEVAQLDCGAWTVRVPCGFDEGEMRRLLDLVESRC